jgi:ribosomal protein S18 acetylase RimI-like enzyme
MENITFVPVKTKEQIEAVAKLADTIWRQHYTPIIGAGQVSYMLENFQSADAIFSQIQEGYWYYLMEVVGKNAGYLAVKPETDKLFLSKIYIDQPYRGKKLASRSIAFLESLCAGHKWNKIYLTVNRKNTSSIAAYHAMGFMITDEQKTDIGGGYVMDDYVMEKQVHVN